MITFDSIDVTARTATFFVDGQPVTRGIASHITDDTLADHLAALARGLEQERVNKPAAPPTLDASKLVLRKGDDIEAIEARRGA